MMIHEIKLLLVAAVAAAAASDNSTMHIMEGPNTAPPLPAPNSTVASCANFTCAAGDVCMMQAVNCIVAPCHPIPTCVPRVRDGPSCMTIKCAANTTCVDLPTGSVCQPIGDFNSTVDPCSTMRCGNGTICKLQTVNCLVAPCPPLAQCVSPSTGPSCMTMKCAANTTCVDLPTGSVCQPNGGSNSTVDACATMRCGNGTICRIQTVNCLLPPCPPLAQCVSPSPSTGPSCMTMKCAANTTCVDLPTGSDCQPNGGSNSTVDACATMRCGNGTICRIQTVNCLLPPCPPIAQCVSPSPSTGPSCMTMKCAANTTCFDLPSGSVCQPNGDSVNPCAAMLCANGTICKLQTVNCLLPPCPPLAQCVSPSTGPSCMTMKCAANTTCVDLPTGSVCQPNGGSSDDPCALVDCAIGTVCQLKTVNCVRAPCPPVAECVPRSTNTSACLHIKCQAGFECRNGNKGETCYPISAPQPDACTNHTCPAGEQCSVLMVNCLVAPCPPPKPSCIPNHDDSPCNAMECAKGFFCIVQHGEPECIHQSGASCAATSCPVNTTCIEFRGGAACMAGHISGGCANVTCGGGSHCKETADGPRCISGGKRDDRVVDVWGCGRGEQYTECKPPCEDTCRGIQTCDRSIAAPSNNSLWTPESNHTIWTNSTAGNGTNLPSHCVSGCICRDHFKRNVQGNCVPNNRCWLTPGCRDNESWARCRGCDRTCANPTGRQVCAEICLSGCSCDEGYVRTKRGMCVLPEDCRAVDLINGDHGNHTIAIEG